jgi:hypothetical protein
MLERAGQEGLDAKVGEPDPPQEVQGLPAYTALEVTLSRTRVLF